MCFIASSNIAPTLSETVSSTFSLTEVGVFTLPLLAEARDRLTTSGGSGTWLGSWHRAMWFKRRPMTAACSTWKPTECNLERIRENSRKRDVKLGSFHCSEHSRELKHARFWDADGNRKWVIFTFDLPSHNHIHIAKYLFSIRDE